MAEIGFYHLTRTGPDRALPPLLGRTLAAGERALVLCDTEERMAALDDALWLCPDPDWLPHARLRDGPDGQAAMHAALQPILLALRPEPANGARFLFLIDGGPDGQLPETLEGFERVFDLFDGNDETAVARARARWTAAREGGHALTYWQQGERGWVKK